MSINVKDFRKALESTISEAVRELTGREQMSQLGAFITDDMRKRIQLGYGVRKNGGKREKFKGLSSSYIEQRRNKLGFWTNANGVKIPIKTDTSVKKTQARKNSQYLKQNAIKLGSNTSPKKSNLTRTGKMVRSIGFLYQSNKLYLGFKTTEGGKKAAFVSKDRPFFFMTDQEIRRSERFIQKRFKEIIARNVRKYF